MEKLLKLRDEMREDLLHGSIFPFWQKYTVDVENGGFYGAVTVDQEIQKDAPKGLVLNARLLWTFAGAYRIFGDPAYKALADRAFDYIREYFWDAENGGGFWMLNADGTVLDDTKMTYGQGFLLYAFSEYVRATGSEEARKYADLVYDYIENECREGKYYLENARGTGSGNGAITEAGNLSMNTHIHILEPMTCYFRIRHDRCVEESLANLIEVTGRRIYDTECHHFIMFFDSEMNPLPGEVSFGHDIEGSWLLTEAAEVLEKYGADQARAKALLREAKEVAIHMVNFTLEHGLDADGGLFDEGYEAGGIAVPNKVWWGQAEAVVGCVNAYQITGDERYADTALKVWEYIKREVINGPAGEWLAVGRNSPKEENSHLLCGPWKCPYHNARAAFEICERVRCAVNGVRFVPVDAENRVRVNAFLMEHWFATDMIIRGVRVDMTKAQGIVALENDEIAGLMMYGIDGADCEILSLDSLCPNTGLGTALIGEAEKIARQNGCTRLKLITTNDNIHALRFYQKRGFDMARLYRNALEVSRRMKPSIPLIGENDIPLRHEIEFEKML